MVAVAVAVSISPLSLDSCNTCSYSIKAATLVEATLVAVAATAAVVVATVAATVVVRITLLNRHSMSS